MRDEIVIRVPRKKSGITGDTNRRKGIISVRRRETDLPRRLKKGGINFYTFGLIKNSAGDYVDLDFSVLNYTTNYPSAPNILSFTAANWNSYRDLLLSVPAANFKNVYKKLGYESAERYGVDFVSGVLINTPDILPIARANSRLDVKGNAIITSDNWTDKGLKISSADKKNFGVTSFGAFLDFRVGKFKFSGGGTLVNPYFKVTPLPDYNADEIDFTLAENADIFLVPVPTLKENVSFISGYESDYRHRSEVLVGKFGLISQSFWLAKGEDLGLDYSIFSYYRPFPFHLNPPPPVSVSTAARTDYLNHIKSSPSPLCYHYDYQNPAFPMLAGYYESRTIDSFPEYDNFTIYRGHNQSIFEAEGGLNPIILYNSGTLSAVIQQQNKTYYVWCKYGTIRVSQNSLSFNNIKQWTISFA